MKTLAASYQVTNAEPNDKGEIFKRPGTPADLIPRPEAYPNDQAAAAVLGKAPPDMNLLAKARKYERGFPWFVFDALPGLEYQEVGSDYIDAILNGYTKPDDPQWNLYYPGHTIAMPQPISGRRGQIHRRHRPNAKQLFQGHHSVPELGRRAEPPRTEKDRSSGDALPVCALRSALFHQEAGLGRGPLTSGVPARCRRPRFRGRSRV